jgi:hypothetical protein
MSRTITFFLGGLLAFLVGSAFALSGCSRQPAQPSTSVSPPAPTQPEYTPVLSLNQMMVAVVDSHSHEIWDAAEKPPKTDEGWATLEHAAATLAVSGSLTKMSGNGPDDERWLKQPDWSKHSQTLSDAGLATLRAVNARNAEALGKAGDQLVLSCIACHKEYRLNVPRIWSDHEARVGG